MENKSQGAKKPPLYLKQRIIGKCLGLFIFFLSRTFRYRLIFEDPQDNKLLFEDLKNKKNRPGHNLIYAVFHQDEIAGLPFFSFKNICILVSQSKDGQMLASALHAMGYDTVRGSSHRGGVAGLIAGIKRVQIGQKMAIAIDGPRGPRYEVKEGILKLAEKSNRPIVPVRVYPKNSWCFHKSWSHSRVPKPFSQIEIYIGKIQNYDKNSLQNKLLSLCPHSNT